MKSNKGIGPSKAIIAITALMLSLIGISITLELINTLSDTTGTAKDTDELGKLRDAVRETCNRITGEADGEDIPAGEQPERKIEFEMNYADKLTKKDGDDGKKLLMNFPEGKTRDLKLPEGCSVSFVEDSGGELSSGLHKLNVTGEVNDDPNDNPIDIRVDDG